MLVFLEPTAVPADNSNFWTARGRYIVDPDIVGPGDEPTLDAGFGRSNVAIPRSPTAGRSCLLTCPTVGPSVDLL